MIQFCCTQKGINLWSKMLIRKRGAPKGKRGRGMKGVMLSIQPKWCELIASGKKTVDIRKSRPELDTPFKVYMYCTKPKKKYCVIGYNGCSDELYKLPNGQIKFGDSVELMLYDNYNSDNFLCGKVIGEFVCDRIDKYNTSWLDGEDRLLPLSCLNDEEIMDYMNGYLDKMFYAWHISDLKIYDKTKELGEFENSCTNISPCEECKFSINDENIFGIISIGCYRMLSRPPQSWCYVDLI